MKENVYNSKVTFQGKFDYKAFYSGLKKYFKNSSWVGIFDKDNYETLYYHKITPENINLIRFKWEFNKEFWKEEPKIKWYLTLDIWISGYNPTTMIGRLDASISGDHEVEEFKEPEVKSLGEKILSVFIDISKLKGNLEKVRTKSSLYGQTVVDRSAQKLYEECEKIKKWISDFVNLYY